MLSFPPATEMFQFAGFAAHGYGFTMGYRIKRWVAPFGDPRINGRSPLPSAFRSVPRPSSPLGTKASTRCPSCAAPAPNPKHTASPCAENRGQTTEDRPDLAAQPTHGSPQAPFCSPFSVTCSLEPVREHRPAAARAAASRFADARASAAHTHAQARPHPTSAMMGDDGRTCFTVTTRFTMS